MPTEIKIIYDVKKNSLGADYKYKNVYSKSSQIAGKQLQIVVPDTILTQTQIEAINSAIAYGREKGVKVIITVGR